MFKKFLIIFTFLCPFITQVTPTVEVENLGGSAADFCKLLEELVKWLLV